MLTSAVDCNWETMALQETDIIPGETSPLLWNSPLITVQMLSEFIERLPLKHKEKIWARHSKGQHIPKNRILDVLYSFITLCIKIKSQNDIENTLAPFVDVVDSQTASDNGMCHSEFNNELHFWILEPVDGLSIVNEEHKMWMDEIEALREELDKAQNENAELHTSVATLQEEAKENKLRIESITAENIELRRGKDKTRDSEDDEDDNEMDPDDTDTQTPGLIAELQQKPLSEFEVLYMRTSISILSCVYML